MKKEIRNTGNRQAENQSVKNNTNNRRYRQLDRSGA